MRGISILDQMISQAMENTGMNFFSPCIMRLFDDTPEYIRKLKQGVQYYTKRRRMTLVGRRKVLFNRRITSMRITDSRSVLA